MHMSRNHSTTIMRYCRFILPLIIMAMTAMPQALPQNNGERPTISRTDSVMINFRQSKWDLDTGIGDNAKALESIDRRLTEVLNDSVYRLRSVKVFGGASPEGTVAFNRFLSEHRAAALFGWFDRYNQLSDLDKTFIYFGRDWEGVLRLAEKDANLPHREETLALLRTIVGEKQVARGEEPPKSLERMKRLRGGVPYRYLYRNIFPAVRASKVVIGYERVLAPEAQQKTAAMAIRRDTIFVERLVEVRDTVYIDTCNKGKK